jgi:hypothetical protein
MIHEFAPGTSTPYEEILGSTNNISSIEVLHRKLLCTVVIYLDGSIITPLNPLVFYTGETTCQVLLIFTG